MMKVRNYSLAIVLAAFAVGAAPALAQSPREGGSPGGGGDNRAGGGGAGNAGSAGGGSVATGGGGGGVSSGGGSSSGGGTFSSPSGFSATSPNISMGERIGRQTAPERRADFAAYARGSNAGSEGQRATPRAGSGSSAGSGSGERAVPRGSSAEGGRDRSSAGENAASRSRVSPPSRDASGGAEANNTAGAREVPNWSRPRGDRPVTGTAVERTGPPPSRDGYYRGRYYDPFYYGYGGFGSPYYSYYYPYGFGLGYGLYSGFGGLYYDPWDPFYSGYAGYMGSGSYSSGVYNTRDQGNLKLKVKPRNAKVYVDGFFVGLVDEFDGAFQKLALNGGRHKVEVRAEGYETAEFDVLITPDQTVTFQGELKRIQ
jgi:hypothetical protein